MKFKIFTVLKTVTVVIITWSSFHSPAFCQEQHNSSHSEHEINEIELGISAGYAYLKEDKEEGVNLHLHLMKRLSGEGFQKYLSIGLGAETIIADEKHYAVMFSLAVHPTPNLIVSISPGIEWSKHGGKWEHENVTHVETAYVYEGSGFHYGPVIGYSKTEDEKHYTFGIHFGIPL